MKDWPKVLLIFTIQQRLTPSGRHPSLALCFKDPESSRR